MRTIVIGTVVYIGEAISNVTFAATFTINNILDGAESNPGDGICVTSTGWGGGMMNLGMIT